MLLLLADGRFRALGQRNARAAGRVCFVALCGLLTHRMARSHQAVAVRASRCAACDGSRAACARLRAGAVAVRTVGEAAVIRYALVAAVLGFHRGLRLLGLSVLALCVKVCFATRRDNTRQVSCLARWCCSVCLWACEKRCFGELFRQQIEHKRRVADAIDDPSRQAELFRLNLTETSLVATTTEWTEHGSRKTAEHIDRSDAERLILRSAVVMVRQNLDALVGLLRQALG